MDKTVTVYAPRTSCASVVPAFAGLSQAGAFPQCAHLPRRPPFASHLPPLQLKRQRLPLTMPRMQWGLVEMKIRRVLQTLYG